MSNTVLTQAGSRDLAGISRHGNTGWQSGGNLLLVSRCTGNSGAQQSQFDTASIDGEGDDVDQSGRGQTAAVGGDRDAISQTGMHNGAAIVANRAQTSQHGRDDQAAIENLGQSSGTSLSSPTAASSNLIDTLRNFFSQGQAEGSTVQENGNGDSAALINSPDASLTVDGNNDSLEANSLPDGQNVLMLGNGINAAAVPGGYEGSSGNGLPLMSFSIGHNTLLV